MKSLTKEVFLTTFGLFLILSGVFGWFLPLIPGTLLVFLGLFLVATQWSRLNHWLEILEDKYLDNYPQVKRKLRKARKKIKQLTDL